MCNKYKNVLSTVNFDPVTISPSTGSTTTTAGERGYSLNCSATLTDPSHLPFGVPSPNFQWSFDGSASLPSGVTAMPTIMSSSNSTSETYTSNLQFSSPLSQSLHTGNYTCRLGPGRLMNNAMVTVNGKFCRWVCTNLYSVKLLRGLMLVFFVDDRLTVKLNSWNKLDCIVHKGCECTNPQKLNLLN